MTITPHRPLAAALLAGAALLLGGCATMERAGPAEVTRFHNGTYALAGQSYVIDLAAPLPMSTTAPGGWGMAGPMAPGGLAQGAYAAAVERELRALGMVPAAPGAAQAHRVRVSVEEALSAPEARRGPVSVGVGGSTGSYGSGLGLGIGLNLGGGAKERVFRRMSVRIDQPGGVGSGSMAGQAIWEGRAETSVHARSREADAPVVAERLARALFAGFPGESGRTIAVP